MDRTNDGLMQAIADGDAQAVRCFVADQRNSLLRDWQDGSLEQVRHTLQGALQRSHRVRRQSVAPEDGIPYELGVWEGWIQAFRALYDTRSREKEILDALSAGNPDVAAAAGALSRLDRPVRHEELAAALGIAYGELTDAMGRLVGCGAVSASGTGRNTRYALTEAGRRCLAGGPSRDA